MPSEEIVIADPSSSLGRNVGDDERDKCCLKKAASDIMQTVAFVAQVTSLRHNARFVVAVSRLASYRGNCVDHATRTMRRYL